MDSNKNVGSDNVSPNGAVDQKPFYIRFLTGAINPTSVFARGFKIQDYWKKHWAAKAGAEFVGTFLLVFLINWGVGTNSSYVAAGNPDGSCTRPVIDKVATGLVYFLSVAIPTYIFGHISEAHFNPMTTFWSFWLGLLGKSWSGAAILLVTYWAMQFAGGFLGATLAYAALGGPSVSANAVTGAGAVCSDDALLTRSSIVFVESALGFLAVFIGLSVIPMFKKSGQNSRAAIYKGSAYLAAGLLAANTSGAGVNLMRYLPTWVIYSRAIGSKLWLYVAGDFLIGPAVAFLIVLAYHYPLDGDFYTAFWRKDNQWAYDGTDNTGNQKQENQTRQYNANLSNTTAPIPTRNTQNYLIPNLMNRKTN